MLISSSALLIWGAGLLFGLSHSWLATDSCKLRAARLGIPATRYRFMYSLLGTVLTGLWLWLTHALPDAPLYHLSGVYSLALMVMQLIGLGVLLLSFRAFDAGVFLGFRPMPAGGEGFVERGIYRHMRHPMYTGVMLMLLASPTQSVNSLNLGLAVSLYFIIGSIFEERRMLAAHREYAAYCKHVPRFIPWRSIASLFSGRGSSQ